MHLFASHFPLSLESPCFKDLKRNCSYCFKPIFGDQSLASVTAANEMAIQTEIGNGGKNGWSDLEHPQKLLVQKFQLEPEPYCIVLLETRGKKELR